jgi:hypothetical protein
LTDLAVAAPSRTACAARAPTLLIMYLKLIDRFLALALAALAHWLWLTRLSLLALLVVVWTK